METKPQDAYAKFEQLSRQVKEDKLIRESKTAGLELEHPEQQFWTENLAATVNLFAGPKPEGEGDEEEEEEEPEPNEGDLPDVLAEQRLLETAGAGFGAEESYRIMLSLKDLLKSNPLQSVRLFGKIYGTGSDYLIAETLFKEGEGESDDEEGEEEDAGAEEEEEEDEEDEEAAALRAERDPQPAKKKVVVIPKERREGVNKYTYWVCSFPGDAWKRLPSVTPEQIMAARRIKKFFTGDLEADVASYPPFPGNEAAYLRAQIARIAHACSVSPRGFFVADEDAGDEDELAVVKNDEFEEIPVDELADTQNWTHHEGKVLLQGRTVHWAPEPEEEEEEEEEDGEEKEPEPTPAELEPEEGPGALMPLAEDDEVGELPLWSARLTSALDEEYTSAVVENASWPGAVAVARGAAFVNLYVGYGHKHTGTPFAPPALPPVQQEEEDLAEVADPTVEQEKQFEKPEEEEEDEEEEEESEDED